MGKWYNPSKKNKATNPVKVIDPKPVWEITIQKEGKLPYKIYAGSKVAEEYFKAGFPVKLKTNVGTLQQYD